MHCSNEELIVLDRFDVIDDIVLFIIKLTRLSKPKLYDLVLKTFSGSNDIGLTAMYKIFYGSWWPMITKKNY